MKYSIVTYDFHKYIPIEIDNYKGNNITTDVLLRICEAFDCTIDNILDTIKE